MSRYTKRKLEDFDPNKSDSDDGDYDNRAQNAARSRPKGRSARASAIGRKPPKRRRERYGGSDDDIDDDDLSISEEEQSFNEDSGEEGISAVNQATGRRQRKAARKPVKYEESSDEEIQATSSEEEPSPRAGQASHSDRPSLVVKLKLRMPVETVRGARATRSNRPTSRQGPSSETSGFGTRRSSRISRQSEEPLVQLTDSGKHAVITREGSRPTSEEPPRRSSRAGKSVKKLPSAIMEASQEDSGPAEAADPSSFVSQLQEHADVSDERMGDNTFGQSNADDEDIVPGSDAEAAAAAPENAEHDADVDDDDDGDDDDDDDDGPMIRRPSRTTRIREKPPSPVPARRSLRSRKPGVEQSSDFEPDAEEDAEENVSDDELAESPRKKSKSSDSDSGTGRRSGRLANKRTRGSTRVSARSQSPASALDPDELADEVASLEDDRRRNKRPRRGRRVEQISYEPNLRNRSNRPDYRVFRPELVAQLDAEDDAEPPTASQSRPGRRTQPGYRSLFSTLGPFGGAGGPPPVFGGPSEGVAATGGVDSDSSDDDAIRRPSNAVGGAVAATPIAGQAPFGAPIPLTHNADPAQTAPGGAPAQHGKVKDKKSLADADPLGVDPNVNFDSVGGLGDHIDRLKEMVALPLLYPEIFMRMHVTPPRGVLFHGPPGTGKTLLARALASSVSSHGKKVTFYMRKGADALSKWVGEAERQLRMLFDEARKNQPSIIFFDEIDGLAPVRSSKQEQIHASIVATLLALMDGMDGRGQVIVIGATNRPDSVDPALRRPGRFDREFFFPLPNKEARRAIIDINTKGWDPPLKPHFKDQLAELTKGYGGADLRALCTEAALNAVQGTFPQIYSSDKKLLIDPSQIKVLAKDFMLSVNKIVPSSERSVSSSSAPLKKTVEPLLRKNLQEIQSLVADIIPKTKKRTALEEAAYDDRDDELGFEKEALQREFEGAQIFRPRLLICGRHGMGQQYLGSALLNKFDGLYVANFDLSNIYKDSTRSAEAAIVQMFEEVKRHKPSVIYIPNVDAWYQSMQDAAIKTFNGLLRSLPPTDPVLLLGIMDALPQKDTADATMVRDLFGYSSKNIYVLSRPDLDDRQEFFQALLDYIRRSPAEFPDPDNRKKRDIPQLPEAPLPPQEKHELTQAELKAQKKKDRQSLNVLKINIQPIMDYIKQKYKKFRNPPIDERAFAYLFDEQDPEMLTTDMPEDHPDQQLYRPYVLDKDKKGVMGIREVATGKFYYNLEIVTIEHRLSNGYYKRPKDFLQDIKRLAKDAVTLGDQDRIIKTNELFCNVEVDMATLQSNNPSWFAEWEAVYRREKQREAEETRKLQQAGQQSTSKIPVDVTTSTEPSTGPIRLGLGLPTLKSLPVPSTPQRSDLSNGHVQSDGSYPHSNGTGHLEDVEMGGTQESALGAATGSQAHPQTPAPNTLTQKSQRTSIMQMAPGSQARDYHNSASTTTSGQKTGDRSRSDRSSGHTGNTHRSNGIHGNGPDFTLLDSINTGGLPDTQEQFSQATPYSSPDHFQTEALQATAMPPPSHHPPPHDHIPAAAPKTQPRKTSDISSLLNNPSGSAPKSSAPPTNKINNSDPQSASHPTLILPDPGLLAAFQTQLVGGSSGLSVEQLEQLMAALMRAVWESKREWNRVKAVRAVETAFNETIRDIEEMQVILPPSQKDDEYLDIFWGRRGGGVSSSAAAAAAAAAARSAFDHNAPPMMPAASQHRGGDQDLLPTQRLGSGSGSQMHADEMGSQMPVVGGFSGRSAGFSD